MSFKGNMREALLVNKSIPSEGFVVSDAFDDICCAALTGKFERISSAPARKAALSSSVQWMEQMRDRRRSARVTPHLLEACLYLAFGPRVERAPRR